MQQSKGTWGDAVASFWANLQADLTKVAAPVLFISFVATTVSMTPGEMGVEKIMFMVVQVFLDFAGAGLLIMSNQGEKKNGFYRFFGGLLIGLTIISAVLAALSLLVPSWLGAIGYVNDVMLVVRSVVSILYGVIMHNEHAKEMRRQKDASAQQQQTALVAEANDQLALENKQRLASIQQQIDTMSHMTIDYDRLISMLLPLLQNQQSSHLFPEQIEQSEQRILARLEEQKNEVIAACFEALKSESNQERNTDELLALIDAEITPEIPDEKEPDITSVIPEVKEPVKAEKKEPDYSDVIAKFPGVNEWLSDGLSSVSVEQIMKATNFTSQKIARAKLAKVRNGNKRLENVLNWLRKEPVNNPVKKEVNNTANKGEKKAPITQPLSPRITQPLSVDMLPDFDDDILDINPCEIEPELEEVGA
jgi:hypothetical protein